jgi:hypothetical protein
MPLVASFCMRMDISEALNECVYSSIISGFKVQVPALASSLLPGGILDSYEELGYKITKSRRGFV